MSAWDRVGRLTGEPGRAGASLLPAGAEITATAIGGRRARRSHIACQSARGIVGVGAIVRPSNATRCTQRGRHGISARAQRVATVQQAALWGHHRNRVAGRVARVSGSLALELTPAALSCDVIDHRCASATLRSRRRARDALRVSLYRSPFTAYDRPALASDPRALLAVRAAAGVRHYVRDPRLHLSGFMATIVLVTEGAGLAGTRSIDRLLRAAKNS